MRIRPTSERPSPPTRHLSQHLSRRRWLGQITGLALAPAIGRAVAGTPTSDSPDAALLADYRCANRVSWGATDAELQHLQRLGRTAYLAEQLTATPVTPTLPDIAQRQIDALQVQRQPLPELLREVHALRQAADQAPDDAARAAARQTFQQTLNRLRDETATRLLLRALYAPRQLHEQMSWFWFNHFNVHQGKRDIRAMLADFEETAIRPHALGSLRQLLGAVTRHPAMLRYLDNDQNAVAHLNENHARELLELHTLGVDAGYTQADVQELARVLSGHGVRLEPQAPRLRPDLQPLYVRDGVYEFHPGRHDFGGKTLLGRAITGRGAAELDEVLDLLAAHPATARFISSKIARFWLAEPPATLVEAMAARLQASGRIADALAVLLHSAVFNEAGPGKFKDPMHYVISAVRAAHGEHVVLNTLPMQHWLRRLGQGLYDRQTPDGYPSEAPAWNSSGQMAVRFDIARAIGSAGANLYQPEPGSGLAAQPGFAQLARPIYYQIVRPAMREPTRQALDSAASPQDWNTLYLASPDFMST